MGYLDQVLGQETDSMGSTASLLLQKCPTRLPASCQIPESKLPPERRPTSDQLLFSLNVGEGEAFFTSQPMSITFLWIEPYESFSRASLWTSRTMLNVQALQRNRIQALHRYASASLG